MYPLRLIRCAELLAQPRGTKIHDRPLDLLAILSAATAPSDLTGVAGYHGLKGRRKGEYAMTVTGNWRLTFGFRDNDIVDVSFEDTH